MMEQPLFHVVSTILLLVKEESLASDIEDIISNRLSGTALFALNCVHVSSLDASLDLLENRTVHTLVFDPDVTSGTDVSPQAALSNIRRHAPAVPILLLVGEQHVALIEYLLRDHSDAPCTYIRKGDVTSESSIHILRGLLDASQKRDCQLHTALHTNIDGAMYPQYDRNAAMTRRRELEQRRFQQRTLLSLATHSAVAAGRLETALPLITETAAAFLDVERVNIWRLHPDGKYHCLDSFIKSCRKHEQGEIIEPADHPRYFHALATERVLDVADVMTDPRTSEFAEGYWQPNGIVSALDVLVHLRGQPVGMICYEHLEHRKWTPDEIAFASQVADLIAQVYLHAETHQRLQEVSLLSRVINITASATRLQPALQEICDALAQFFDAPRSAFALVNDKGTRAEVIAEHRSSDDMPSAMGTHIPVENNPSMQHLMTRQEPLAVSDTRTDPRMAEVKPILRRHGIISILLVPVIAEGELVGTFGIDALEPREFTEEEITLAENVAQQVGQALQRLRLFGRMQNRAELKDKLATVAGDLNRSFTVDEALERIGEGALVLSDADRVAVYVREPNNTFSCGWSHNISPEYVARVQQGFDAMPGHRLLRTDDPIKIPDISHFAADSDDDTTSANYIRRLAKEEGFRAFALWPLVHEGQTLAALGSYYDSPKEWSTAEEDVMQTYTRQAAAAYESARLFEAEREQRQLAEALREAGNVLTASLEFERVLDHLLAQIGRVVPYDAANVMLVDGDRTVMVRTRGYEQLGDDIARANENMTFNISETRNLRRLIETGEPFVIPDIREYDGWIETSGNSAIRSWAGAPIMVQGEVVALFSVDKFEPNFYQSKHAHRLAMFAGQVALALQNARLFEELQQRVQELSTLAETSVAMRDAADIDELGPLLATQASQLVRADAAIVSLIDQESEESVVVGFEGVPATIAEKRYPIDAGICRFVMQHRTVYRSNNLADDAFVDDRDVVAHLGAALVVPLTTSANDIVGSLLVARSQSSESSFPNQDEQLLQTLAEMAANTLERAQAHQELEAAYVETVLALAKAVDVRDNYTSDHSHQLARLAESTAEELGLDADTCATVRWAALLHDIGKIGVPDEVLRKAGPLTDREWEIMRLHPEIGAEIVAPVKQLEAVAPLIRAHQERYDGKGYPDALKGDEIPLGARIVAVVDAYSAITDERVYGVAQSHSKALAELERCSGTQFDPDVVDAFLRVVKKTTTLT